MANSMQFSKWLDWSIEMGMAVYSYTMGVAVYSYTKLDISRSLM